MRKGCRMALRESLESHRRAFLEALRARGRSPATLQAYGLALGMFLAFLKKRRVRRLSEATAPEIIRGYQDTLVSYRPASRASWLGALRLFFAHLAGRGVIRENPGAAIVIPKVPDRLPRKILSQEEIRRIMAAPDPATAKGVRDRAILEMLYSTALRRAEMAALCVLDVDLAGGMVRVNHGKGGKDRVTPMGEAACDAVKKYFAHARDGWTSNAGPQSALWLGSRPPHLPLSKIGLGSVVRDAAKAAGLSRPISPHVFRHSCATHMVQGGVNIALVQQLLGHQSLATTQIYTRVAVPDLVEMVRQSHPRK